MTSPALAAVEAVADLAASYVTSARYHDAAACRGWVAHHQRWADVAREHGDIHAEALHAHLAVLYAAHAMTALAAECVALGGVNPMGEP